VFTFQECPSSKIVQYLAFSIHPSFTLPYFPSGVAPVLLGEPPRTQFDLNFSLSGIPVRVHPFFWLAGLLLGPRQGGPPVILAWIVAFFAGILCHEVGHALVLRRLGDFPWITLYGLGGMASSNRTRGFSRGNAEAWQQILISAAGPLAGFLLALIVIAVVWTVGYQVACFVGAPFGFMVYAVDVSDLSRHPQLLGFVNNLLFVTVVYGILNLLPIYPLDGGQISREILIMVLGREGVRQSLILSMFVATVLAVAAALLWNEFLFALFFGYFAYSSYATLQTYSGRSPW
jgi:stage IV sporulation protein FB